MARFFRKPLATHLIQEALGAGITHASLTFGNIGFAKGAKALSADMAEIGFDMLPVCVELVGPRPLLEQFVRERQGQLQGATLVMLEGVHLHSMIAEDGSPPAQEKVEYVRLENSPESSSMPAEQVHSVLGNLAEPSEG